MAGRCNIIIDAKELKLYDQLVAELAEKGHIIRDNSRLRISFLSPYQPKPNTETINKAYDRLCRYIIINGCKVVNKKTLCTILKITKPTLDSWIRNEWIFIPQYKFIRQIWDVLVDVYVENPGVIDINDIDLIYADTGITIPIPYLKYDIYQYIMKCAKSRLDDYLRDNNIPNSRYLANLNDIKQQFENYFTLCNKTK